MRVLAILLALSLSALAQAKGRESPGNCEPKFEKFESAAQQKFDPKTPVRALQSGQVYRTSGFNGQCCMTFAFSEKILKWMNDPRNSQLAEKWIHALANGVVGAEGRTGLKQVEKGIWEVKIMGDRGDSRLMGCADHGLIHFNYFAPNHADAHRFIRQIGCR